MSIEIGKGGPEGMGVYPGFDALKNASVQELEEVGLLRKAGYKGLQDSWLILRKTLLVKIAP